MVGTVSTGWPWARAERSVVLPEFSRPITTMSNFLVKNTSRSLANTAPIVCTYVVGIFKNLYFVDRKRLHFPSL